MTFHFWKLPHLARNEVIKHMEFNEIIPLTLVSRTFNNYMKYYQLPAAQFSLNIGGGPRGNRSKENHSITLKCKNSEEVVFDVLEHNSVQYGNMRFSGNQYETIRFDKGYKILGCVTKKSKLDALDALMQHLTAIIKMDSCSVLCVRAHSFRESFFLYSKQFEKIVFVAGERDKDSNIVRFLSSRIQGKTLEIYSFNKLPRYYLRAQFEHVLIQSRKEEMVYDFESYAGVVKAWRCGKMFHGISTIQLKNPWNIEPLDTKFLSMRGVSEAPREMREQGLLFRVEREIDSKCAYFYSSRKLFKLDAF